MSEVKTKPILTYDADMNPQYTFTDKHTLADIARWIAENEVDAETIVQILLDEHGIKAS